MKNFCREFIVFGFKQAWACLFGAAMLALILVSKLFWEPDWLLPRYDFLFLAALFIQLLLLLTRLETVEEAKVIFLFHIVGTVMELFKTHIGSWSYPEENFIRIAGVPLFSGFMYSSIGSYIARNNRILKQEYVNYPPFWATVVLCVLIYINFFSHHYIVDFRYALFAFAFILFFKTRVYFTVYRKPRWMPLLLGFTLVAFFIWIAENISTFAGAWMYPHQRRWQMVDYGIFGSWTFEWEMVSIEKMGSWFLLMIISFVLVTFVHRPLKKQSVN